jgi:hypothetical protein
MILRRAHSLHLQPLLPDSVGYPFSFVPPLFVMVRKVGLLHRTSATR